MNYYSKKNKLPKYFWEKGKSKFVDIRLHEEGLKNINQMYTFRFKIKMKIRQWFYRNIEMLKEIIRLMKNPEFTGSK